MWLFYNLLQYYQKRYQMICILLCDGYDIEKTESMKLWLSKLDIVKYIFPSSLPQFINIIKILCIPDGNPEFIASSLRGVSKHIIEYVKSGGILITCGGGSHSLSLIKTYDKKLSLPFVKHNIMNIAKYNKNDRIIAQSHHVFPCKASQNVLDNDNIHICDWCLNHETIHYPDIAYDVDTILYFSTVNVPLCFFKFLNKYSGGILHLHVFPKDPNDDSTKHFDNILNDISNLAYGKDYKNYNHHKKISYSKNSKL